MESIKRSSAGGRECAFYVRELPLPELYEPVSPPGRAAHFDDRLDRFRCSACSVFSLVLDRSVDQGRCSRLSFVQDKTEIDLPVIISLRMFDLYYRIGA